LTFSDFTSAVYTETRGVKYALVFIKWVLCGLNVLVSVAAITDSCFCFAFLSDPLEGFLQLSLAFLVLFDLMFVLNVSACTSPHQPNQAVA